MLYTPSHAELAQHPKMRKLARLLGTSIPTALGHLHLLWHFALKYAPDGDLARFDNDEVADGCMWEGDSSDLYDALRGAGCLNDDATIHDWEDYGGKALKQKESNAERQQRWRDRNKTDTSQAPNNPVTVTSPLHNALDKIRGEKRREEESILRPAPPTGAKGGDAHAPRQTPPAPTVLHPAPKPKDAPPVERPRDLLFEAVCDACLIDWHQLTDTERGRVNHATAQIRKAGGTTDSIPIHAAHYRLHFTTPLTPMALAGNWSLCANAPPAAAARAPNGRRPTVEDANLALQRQYETQENGHEPRNFPEIIDADWHGDEQGTQLRPLRPVVAQVRGAPR